MLSLDYEPLECNEHLQVIRDYVSLPLDDRKLQSRFQPVLHKTVRETLRQETDRLDRMVGDYLRSVATMMDYPVSFSARRICFTAAQDGKMPTSFGWRQPARAIDAIF